jgi:hypothetical protein
MFLLGPNRFLGLDMVSWLRRQCCDERALELRVNSVLERQGGLQGGGPVERHVDFWPCVEELVLVGRLGDAAELLATHSSMVHAESHGSEAERAESRALKELLTARPLAHPYAHLTHVSTLLNPALVADLVGGGGGGGGGDVCPEDLRALQEVVCAGDADKNWPQLLNQFQHAATACCQGELARRDPRIGGVLAVLAGDVPALHALSARVFGGRRAGDAADYAEIPEWCGHAMALLLYVHSPPVSSHPVNMRRVLYSARDAANDQSRADVLDVMEGHVGVAIKVRAFHHTTPHTPSTLIAQCGTSGTPTPHRGLFPTPHPTHALT